MAGFANTAASTYHWSISQGSTITLDLSPWGTVWVIFSFFTKRFKDLKTSTTFFLASNLSKPSNSLVPFSLIVASWFKIFITSKLSMIDILVKETEDAR